MHIIFLPINKNDYKTNIDFQSLTMKLIHTIFLDIELFWLLMISFILKADAFLNDEY